MKRQVLVLLTALTAFSLPALAANENSYNPSEPLATTPWYGKADNQYRAADLDFIAGMRPHHEGALTMSEEYLTDSGATNAQLKQLARAIYHNQEFEIYMLDTVQHLATRKSSDNDGTRQIATKDLAQNKKFFRMPIPGPWDKQKGKAAGVSAEDVSFAKAMIVHHQAALDMAHIYLQNPAAHNGYLKRMCLDILVDQSREIMFMQSIISQYQGNAAAIQPSAIHGMDHMQGMSHDMSDMPMHQEVHHTVIKKEKTVTTTTTTLTPSDAAAMPAEEQPSDGWAGILRKLKGN